MKTNHLPFLLLYSVCILLATPGCNSPAPTPPAEGVKEEWISLFNGKNLDGWSPKITGHDLNDNYQNTFVVEDSLLKVKYDGYKEFGNKFGHLFYKDPFSWYRLRVEYRFTGEQVPGAPDWAFRNSGVMLHCQPPATMTKDQDFPLCVEAQFLGGDGEHERSTLNLCTPGTNVVMHDSLITEHCISSSSKTYHGDQWVTAEFLVLGDSLIQHIVDGQVVMSYSKPQIGGGAVSNFDPAVMKEGSLLSGGYLSLQSESHPIHFRKVELLNLEGCTDPKAKNYQPWCVKSKTGACVYE
jgi:hypothetical protein